MKQVATRSIVVFGAAATGLTALRRMREDPACEVVAFADNATRLHGTHVEGLPVVPADAIPSLAPERVVVASHRWREIVPQLVALGIPGERIDVYPIEAVARPGRPAARHHRAASALWPDGLPSDRIHYACGQRVLDGWLNVDGFDESYPNGVVSLADRSRIGRMDLTAPHPFDDESFQWGYCEDFLEHLTQAESLVFLCEAYRTFKTGGVLRLSCPGLAGVLRRHLRSGGFAGASTCVEEAYRRWYHQHFYTFDSLQLVASHIGFSDVRRCEYGHSRYPVLKQDARPDQADLNLVVELTK